MTSYVMSADGTTIAFDRLGDGPPVVIVSGMFATDERPTTWPSTSPNTARSSTTTAVGEATAVTPRRTRSLGRSRTSPP